MAQVRYERLSTVNSNAADDIELRVHCYDDNHDSDTPQQKSTETNDNAMMHRSNSLDNATRIPRSQLIQMAISTLLTIFVYLILSITMVFFQRKVIREYKFPFTIVCYHLVIKFTLAYAVRSLYKCHTGKARVLLDFRTTLKKMAPTGIASGIDIGFSSLGFETVTIALYTMTKSSSIIFILIFAILLGLEKKSTLLVFTVSLIAVGLFMFTYKSTTFDALGFVYILVASFSSGIRWSFAQYLMQKTKLGLHNPIDMIFHMQPFMFVSLLPFVAIYEAEDLFRILTVVLPNTDAYTVYFVILKITLVAVLAFLMEVSEFRVLSKTSGLTLSIAGIFKDVCQVVLAVELNDERVNFLKLAGMLVCLAGISCHVFHKYTTFNRMANLQTSLEDDALAFNEDASVSIPNGGAGDVAAYHNRQTNTVNATTRRYSGGAKAPLLEHTDSNESSDDSDGPNSSDVIFDVLKRRDMSR